ncbi:MAG TPA: valine--tRNA ligase [Candidatus Limnocylindrales bacterium]|nr:valine--tRNA ligase [Candidatus Limnocylindrales bacterium]
MTDRHGPAGGAAGAMPPAYRAAEVEAAIYERWLAADVFAPDGRGSRADPSKPPFVIIMPPPNVTGALHLGHAARTTVEDTLIRHARMTRRPTLWLPGKDHASIAAQLVLDRIIAEEGESRASLGRERYLERMYRFVEETRGFMSGQLRRLGASADWGRERFTMDAGSARAVRVSFKRLWDDGLVYRGEALINWCVGCRTSVSDLEVIGTPETGTLWTVRYHLVRDDGTPDPDAWISVATTRPETILGDTAVAVHPEDERYRSFVGRRVLVPFVERVVPIVADDVVERDFGTGAVKITPAHDPNDHETARRHGLPMIDVLDDDGRINDAGGAYTGLERFEARRRIVADLEARGDLEGSRPHEMVIGRCQRSDDVIEPRLKTQWFVRTRPMAAKAIAAVREGRTRIVPRRFEKVYFDWLENIRDWNVSRQLWWGHRIPAWYCPDGHITVSDAEPGPDACATCGRPAAELRQEEDIFDTWYSSGLWPFSTLGWPEHTDDLVRYYPGTVMETAYDIIFFWVARMMMLGEWLTGEAPFRTIFLAGLIRDPYGRKMSKTAGNVIDPLAVIDEIGADALRFAIVHGSTPGNDQRLGEAKLDGARNFGNKLWNAARFVLGARPAELAADAPLALPAAADVGPAEHWILSRAAVTIGEVSRAYDELRLGEAAALLYDSIWSEYCDWYLELAKLRLADEARPAAQRVAIWQVLAWVLERYLRLSHPLMPFITEEIWQRLPHAPDDPGLVMVADWPDATDAAALADADTAAATSALLELVRGIRRTRQEAGLEPAAWLDAELVLPDAAVAAAHASLGGSLDRLARVRVQRVVSDAAALDAGAQRLAVMAGRLEARLTRGAADLAPERARLEGELDDARRQLARAEARLADRAFVAKAPPAVVDGARARAAELRELVRRLEGRLAS